VLIAPLAINSLRPARAIFLHGGVYLPDGHMVMIEKNNLDVARLFDDWMKLNVR